MLQLNWKRSREIQHINWDEWLKVYPGSGFVLTSNEENVEETIEMLEEVNITSEVAGSIIEEKKLYLTHDNQEKIVFDFDHEIIMGIKEEISN